MSQGIARDVLWASATGINATAAITSKAIPLNAFAGFASLEVEIAGSAPSVNITVVVASSEAGVYRTPVNNRGSSLGKIYTGLAATAWIQFPLPVAKFIKIVITGDGTNGANTTALANLIFVAGRKA